MHTKFLQAVSLVGRLILALGAVLLLSPAVRAQSQSSATQGQSQSSASEAVLQEVLVTATRRETAIQQTPMSITALTSDVLEQTVVKDVNDFILQVPNLSAADNGPGNKRYAIRNIQAAGEPEVGLYYDEIPIAGFAGENNDSGAQQPDLNLFDVERVEVLRGPQGTLYGAGSMGGTLRIISKRPDLEQFSGQVQGTYADINHGGHDWDGDIMLNVPIIQSELGARLVGFYHDNGGYIDEMRLGIPDANSYDDYGGRFSLRGKPTSQWTIDFIAYLEKTKQANDFFQMPAYGDWVASDFVKTPRDDEFQGYNLISTTDFSFASLVVLGSYQQRRVTQVFDLTPSVINILGGTNPATGQPNCNTFNYVECLNQNAPFAFFIMPTADINNLFTRAWSWETRLQSAASSKLKWTVGAFGQDRDNVNKTYVGGPTNPDGSISIDPSTGLAVNSVFARQNWDPFQQFAGFGELSYPITPDLDATAGLRYSYGHRTDQYEQIQNFGDPAPYLPGTGYYPKTTYTETATTPKFELSYHPSRDSLYYILASKGFRFGGPNVPNGFAPTLPPPYKSDSLWNYEFGFKNTLLDNRLTIDGALFWINWNNIQQTETDPTGTFTFIGNGGNAVAKGVELAINAQATSRLLLTTGASYTHATLVGPQPIAPIPANQLESGDRFPNVPNWTVYSSATYNFPLATSNAFVRGEFAYRSGQTTALNPLSPAYAELPGYVLFNARAGMAFERYSGELYVTNIADRQTAVGGTQQSGEPLQIVSTPPRTVGLVLRMKF
jgi:iron complex outermembrane recepter protein